MDAVMLMGGQGTNVKRSHLKLFERIRIIRSHEASGCKKSVRALSKEFSLSKSAVAEILKKRDLYVEQYEAFGAQTNSSSEALFQLKQECEPNKRNYLRLNDKMRIIESHENTGKSICALSEEFRIGRSAVADILGKRDAYVEQHRATVARPPTRRSHLGLEDKVQIIRAYQESGGKSVRALSEEFKVSKTAVAEILKKKHHYMRQYEINDPDLVARRHRAQRDYLLTLVWQWYQAAIAKKMTVTGHLLKELAQTYGDALGMEGFDASDEWLESFVRTRRIKQSVIEGGGEDVAFIKRWKMSLPELVGDYEAKDVFVCDETALLYRSLPARGLPSEAAQSCERWTVLLCCSAMGEKVRPFVSVPTLANELCGKELAVTVRNGKQAKMTSELFGEFLAKLNEDMKTQGRKILLFADTAASHRGRIWTLSNVRLEFFPMEVASFVQPLDLGVVRLFKTHYRTELLTQAVSVRRSGQTFEVSPLQGVWWLADAWKAVPEDAIRRCFNEAGFPVACTEFYLTSDAFDVELGQLSELLDCSKDWAGVAPYEYVTFDNTLDTEPMEPVPKVQLTVKTEATPQKRSYKETVASEDVAASNDRLTSEEARQGSQMSYGEMLATVERLYGFAVACEPNMLPAVRELKSVAERLALKRLKEEPIF